ncbi:hypothetical protein [Tenacibaculum bernardetii]|uniref:hypothetical protein n=1 Tax=Tenacibaculum bernardetii TaxID=3021375 RepID=UPI0023B0608D|nr:hypothetical protein [Tenacibaculum bernardetii]
MKNILLFLLITVLPSLSQTKEASTLNGETFILHTDGTWSKKQTNKKRYKFKNANAPYYLRDSLINFEVVKAKFEA